MLDRAFAIGLKPQWVLADALYGSSYEFRKFLLDKNQPYVVAISKQQMITLDFHQVRVDAAVKDLPIKAWHKLSAASGAKGERWYERARLKLCWPTSAGMSQYLMVRRNTKDPKDMSYYFCHRRGHFS